jgi:myosin-5
MQKLKKTQVGNPLIIFDVKQQGRFTLRHFIEDVTYNVNNFLEKNKDTMSQDVEQLLSNSSVSLVKHLFTGTGADDASVDRRSPSISPNRVPAARKVRLC